MANQHAIINKRAETADQISVLQSGIDGLTEENGKLFSAKALRQHHQENMGRWDRFLLRFRVRTDKAKLCESWFNEENKLNELVKLYQKRIKQLGEEEQLFIDTVCAKTLPEYNLLLEINKLAQELELKFADSGVCWVCGSSSCGARNITALKEMRPKIVKLQALCAMQTKVNLDLPNDFATRIFAKGQAEAEETREYANLLRQIMQDLQVNCRKEMQNMVREFLHEGA